MGGSPSDFNVKRLHQLLTARAYLRAALYNIRIGRVYLDSRKDLYLIEDLTNVEELLEATIERLDKEIGFMVYGPPPEIEPDERVQKMMEEIIFGSSSPKQLPVVIKR